MASKDNEYDVVDPIIDWARPASARSAGKASGRRYDDADAIAEAIADLSDPAAFEGAPVMSTADAVASFRKGGLGPVGQADAEALAGAQTLAGAELVAEQRSSQDERASHGKAAAHEDPKAPTADAKNSSEPEDASAAATRDEAVEVGVSGAPGDGASEPAVAVAADSDGSALEESSLEGPALKDSSLEDEDDFGFTLEVDASPAAPLPAEPVPASQMSPDIRSDAGQDEEETATDAVQDDPFADLERDLTEALASDRARMSGLDEPSIPVDAISSAEEDDPFADLDSDLSGALEGASPGSDQGSVGAGQSPAGEMTHGAETASVSGDDEAGIDLDFDLELDEHDLRPQEEANQGASFEKGPVETVAVSDSKDPFEDLDEHPGSPASDARPAQDVPAEATSGTWDRSDADSDDPFADIDEQVARAFEGSLSNEGQHPEAIGRDREGDVARECDAGISSSEDDLSSDGDAHDEARPVDVEQHEADEEGDAGIGAGNDDIAADDRMTGSARRRGGRMAMLAIAASVVALVAAGGWYGWQKFRSDPGMAIDIAAGIGSMLPDDSAAGTASGPAFGADAADGADTKGAGKDDVVDIAGLKDELEQFAPDADQSAGGSPAKGGGDEAVAEGSLADSDFMVADSDPDGIDDIRRRLDELSQDTDARLGGSSAADRNADDDPVGVVSPSDSFGTGEAGQQIEEFTRQLADLEARFDRIEAALAARVDALEQAVSGRIEERLASSARTEAMLPGMMTKLSSIEVRLENVEAKDTTQDMRAIATRLDELSSDIWLIARHGAGFGGFALPGQIPGLGANVPPLGAGADQQSSDTATPVPEARPGPINQAMGRPAPASQKTRRPAPADQGDTQASSRLVSSPDIRAGQYGKGDWISGYGAVLEVRSGSAGDYLVTENGTVFAAK